MDVDVYVLYNKFHEGQHKNLKYDLVNKNKVQ